MWKAEKEFVHPRGNGFSLKKRNSLESFYFASENQVFIEIIKKRSFSAQWCSKRGATLLFLMFHYFPWMSRPGPLKTRPFEKGMKMGMRGINCKGWRDESGMKRDEKTSGWDEKGWERINCKGWRDEKGMTFERPWTPDVILNFHPGFSERVFVHKSLEIMMRTKVFCSLSARFWIVSLFFKRWNHFLNESLLKKTPKKRSISEVDIVPNPLSHQNDFKIECFQFFLLKMSTWENQFPR